MSDEFLPEASSAASPEAPPAVSAEAPATSAPPAASAEAPPPGEDDLTAELTAIYTAHTQHDEAPTAPDSPSSSPESSSLDSSESASPHESPESPDSPAPAFTAPSTWSQDEQDAWNAAPKEVKAALMRRTGEIEAQSAAFEQQRQTVGTMLPYALMMDRLRPYFESVAGADGKPVWGSAEAVGQEIAELAGAKALLMRDPQQGVMHIMRWCQGQGIDVPELLNRLGDEVKALPPTETARARAEADRLRAETRQLRAEVERARHVEQLVQTEHGANGHYDQITAFISRCDEHGEPLFPHLSNTYGGEVSAHMARYLQATAPQRGSFNPQQVQEAYNTAVWSHPEARAAEMRRLEEARVAQHHFTTARARKAAGLVPAASAPSGLRVENLTPQEAMEAVWARYKGV